MVYDTNPENHSPLELVAPIRIRLARGAVGNADAERAMVEFDRFIRQFLIDGQLRSGGTSLADAIRMAGAVTGVAAQPNYAFEPTGTLADWEAMYGISADSREAMFQAHLATGAPGMDWMAQYAGAPPFEPVRDMVGELQPPTNEMLSVLHREYLVSGGRGSDPDARWQFVWAVAPGIGG